MALYAKQTAPPAAYVGIYMQSTSASLDLEKRWAHS